MAHLPTAGSERHPNSPAVADHDPTARPVGQDAEVREGLRLLLLAVSLVAHREVHAADGVGVSVLLDDDVVMAGSNRFADTLDQTQLELGEGPSLSALQSSQAIRSTSIGAGETRWPAFDARASALALRSVVSLPLFVGDDTVGLLNLYGRARDTFAGAGNDIARCSGQVEKSLTGAHLLAMAGSHTSTLVCALNDRGDIELAVGLLMDMYRMTANTARTLLAQLARTDGVSVGEAARSVLDPGWTR